MEGEVFLLGHWKNYEDLEESLSIEELTATLDAMRKKEERDQRFHAALQGIEIGDSSKDQFDEIWKEGLGIEEEDSDESALSKLGIPFFEE